MTTTATPESPSAAPPGSSPGRSRRTALGFVATRRIVEVILTVVLGVGAAFLFYGSNFGLDMVHDQLDAQAITFPAAGSPGLDPATYPGLQQYAGQRVDSGPKAKAYANEFIAVHLKEVADGKTYSQVSAEAQKAPDDAKLAAQVATLFKGETLRGLLLYAWGWSVVSTIALYAAIAATLGFVIMLIATIGDFIADPRIAAHHIAPADDSAGDPVMKAVVYHGPGDWAWEEAPKPGIVDDTDAIVRVDATTICGTDLHILKGDVPAVTPGRILGHEAVGTVEQVGSGVKNVQVGDRVLVSCISACGACRYCRDSMFGQCLGGGGWILGHLIDGTQAEFVGVPFADNSTYPVPAGVSDEEILMLADILPTGYEVGVLNGAVRPGQTIAVVGTGPIGLSAIMGARLYSPSHIIAVDLADSRLEAAKSFGADVLINSTREDPVAVVQELTGGLGADVAIEAVGVPASFDLCTRLIRAGGHVANIGVHGEPATLHLEDLWIKNVTITTGLVDTYSTPTLLDLVVNHQVEPERFITHHFTFDDVAGAYDTFSRAGETGALKVVISRTG